MIYFALWMLFIAVAGTWLVRRQARQVVSGMEGVANAFGFQLLRGMAAVDRSTLPAMRAAAREAREKVPPALRSLVERAAKSALCAAGSIDGIEVAVFFEQRGKTHYTAVRADYPAPLPFELRVGHEGGLQRLGKALVDLSDVEIGDPEFDRAVRVKTADAQAARDALYRPGGREAVLALLAVSKAAYATNAFALWEEQGRHFDVTRTRERLDAVVAVSRALGTR
jgi:hypothetical protein